jgi:peptidoglycan/xylan/chitin deacetylase (PgdA/CDA1 family)
MNNMLNIVMYHYVRDLSRSRYPNIKGLKTSEFITQIEYLESLNCKFISPQDMVDAIDGKKELQEKSVLLTFDDGYIDHYTKVYPILRDRNIPAFFSIPGKILAEHKLLDVNKIHFILASTPIDMQLESVFERLDHYRGSEYAISSNEELFNKLAVANRFDIAETVFIKRLLQVELNENLRNKICDDLFAKCIGISEGTFTEELYLSLDQIKLMSKNNMTFGIHGYEHYWLNRLTPIELEKDILMALDVFSGIVDPNNWICCYPFGSHSEDVEEYIKLKGAVAGFNTVVKTADLNRDGRYVLPRLDANDLPPKSLDKFIR